MERTDIPTASDRLMGKGPKLTHKMSQRVLFDPLLSQDLSTHPKLVHASGFLRPTVIATLNELVDARLAIPLGSDAHDAGKPAKFYQVNPAAASVIAVGIGRVWVHMVVVDIAGDKLCHHDARNMAKNATALVELISTEVSQAKARLLLDPRRTYAVIGSPGVFAPKRGVVDCADQLLGWHRPELVNMFSGELGAQLQIEDDVNLAALTESIHGQTRRHGSFAHSHIRTGAGLATVLNGKLHRGSHGAAGELAYLLTATGVDGRARALEDVVSTRALIASTQGLGLVNPTPKTILQLAVAGDPAARQVMDRFVEGISAAVIVINTVLDPECVVLGGGIGVRLQDYVAEISGAVTRHSPFHIDLEVATLHADATLREAADMDLETARDAMFRLGVPDDLG